MKVRKIVAYKEDFINFYKSQDCKTQEKIEYVLDLIRFEPHIPRKFFKHLDGSNGIYEIRVKTTFREIRILCFLDKTNLVVLTNCFLKKTRKTPRKEIRIAERLKKDYLADNL